MDSALMLSILGQLGLGVASNAVYKGLRALGGGSATRKDIVAILEKISALHGRVDEVYSALLRHRIITEKGSIVEVSGTHSASGSGVVTGLDIQGSAKILPGTVVTASGTGIVTGTRIGGGK